MKNVILTLTVFFSCMIFSNAQGTLQFNQIKIISNSLETVPAGKAWKVNSVYGSEFIVNQCITEDQSNDWLGLKCVSYLTTGTPRQVKVSYFSSILVVNGVSIINEISGMPNSTAVYYTNSNCSGGNNSGYDFTCANRAASPNLIPLWLPEGATILTGGPNTFASVLEFNVIP